MLCESLTLKNNKAALLENMESVPGPEKEEYNLVVSMIKHHGAEKKPIEKLYKFSSHIGTIFAGSSFLRAKNAQRGKDTEDSI